MDGILESALSGAFTHRSKCNRRDFMLFADSNAGILAKKLGLDDVDKINRYQRNYPSSNCFCKECVNAITVCIPAHPWVIEQHNFFWPKREFCCLNLCETS